MNMDQNLPKPVSKPSTKSTKKRKPIKVKPVTVVSPTSAENARQLQLAKKKKYEGELSNWQASLLGRRKTDK